MHTQRPNPVEQQALLFQAHQIVCSAGVLSKISKFQVQLLHLGANIAWHVCIQRANCTIHRFFVQHFFSVTHLSIIEFHFIVSYLNLAGIAIKYLLKIL